MITPVPTSYGDPTPEHLKMMRVVPERFTGAFKGVTVPPPPFPVEDELLHVMRHVQAQRLPEDFCFAVDRNMAPEIVRVASEHGVEADPTEVEQIISDLVPILLRVKYQFNVPRPWQVAPAMGLRLRHLDSPSAATPSYPSGHATQAAAACSFLGTRNPRAARALDDLAARIGQSRLQAGVHYPMDVVAGLNLGRQLGLRIA
jgi:hypothetical protein